MDDLLIKVSIPDGRMRLLHHKGILSFPWWPSLKPSKVMDGTQNIEC